MKTAIPFLTVLFLAACQGGTSVKKAGALADTAETIVARGQMPNAAKDDKANVHVVYGTGDSIMYTSSTDKGISFSAPALVSVLPGLAASHTRGPQIAATGHGLLVTACTNAGNIYSFKKDAGGNWLQTARVNDVDTVAKENLMALGADGQNAFAAWLDLRDKHNKIYGARSTDGGSTWSKNSLIYASPDTTVCECCKPSVAVSGNAVYVMFRNWLDGNRDLYLTQSADGGAHFNGAQKLGTESWALNGCPMDGGAVVVNGNNQPQTVWNRKGVIYASEPEKKEEALGQGKSCTMETVNGKNIYAWVEKGQVTVLKPQGTKTKLGKGQLPVLKAVDNNHVLCIWEADNQIQKAIVAI